MQLCTIGQYFSLGTSTSVWAAAYMFAASSAMAAARGSSTRYAHHETVHELSSEAGFAKPIGGVRLDEVCHEMLRQRDLMSACAQARSIRRVAACHGVTCGITRLKCIGLCSDRAVHMPFACGSAVQC